MLHVVNGDKKKTAALVSFEQKLGELYKNFKDTLYNGFSL